MEAKAAAATGAHRHGTVTFVSAYIPIGQATATTTEVKPNRAVGIERDPNRTRNPANRCNESG